MEYTCSSVDCFCCPLWNGLDRTSPVLGNTLDQSGYLIQGYKPRYQLEVLLFHFHYVQAVGIRCNTPFLEKGLSGISSVSLWKQDEVQQMCETFSITVTNFVINSLVNMLIVQWICSLFQTMFDERGIVLCLFNLNFFVQIDTRFIYLIWNKYSVLLFFVCAL
jgi:hypothetical protein